MLVIAIKPLYQLFKGIKWVKDAIFPKAPVKTSWPDHTKLPKWMEPPGAGDAAIAGVLGWGIGLAVGCWIALYPGLDSGQSILILVMSVVLVKDVYWHALNDIGTSARALQLIS